MNGCNNQCSFSFPVEFLVDGHVTTGYKTRPMIFLNFKIQAKKNNLHSTAPPIVAGFVWLRSSFRASRVSLKLCSSFAKGGRVCILSHWAVPGTDRHMHINAGRHTRSHSHTLKPLHVYEWSWLYAQLQG